MVFPAELGGCATGCVRVSVPAGSRGSSAGRLPRTEHAGDPGLGARLTLRVECEFDLRLRFTIRRSVFPLADSGAGSLYQHWIPAQRRYRVHGTLRRNDDFQPNNPANVGFPERYRIAGTFFKDKLPRDFIGLLRARSRREKSRRENAKDNNRSSQSARIARSTGQASGLLPQNGLRASANSPRFGLSRSYVSNS